MNKLSKLKNLFYRNKKNKSKSSTQAKPKPKEKTPEPKELTPEPIPEPKEPTPEPIEEIINLPPIPKFKKSKVKRRARPNKKEQKILSPKSYQKKYPPPVIRMKKRELDDNLDHIEVVDIDININEPKSSTQAKPVSNPPKKQTIKDILYEEKYVRIGKNMVLVRVKKKS